VGETHTTVHTDPLPASNVTYEYLVVMVDAQRQDVGYPDVFNDDNGFASCPAQSAPIATGTIDYDLGWAVQFSSCDDSPCTLFGYIEGPMAEELRPFTGTGTPLRLYGDVHCGTVEGCSIAVDRWEFGECGTTGVPPRLATLGRIKAAYR
jgi:hypothetical protein